MRKYSSMLDKMRNEMYHDIVSILTKQVGTFDNEHEIFLYEDIFDDMFCEDKANGIRVDKDGDFILYNGDYMVGDVLDFSTDVIAEVADLILDDKYSYEYIDR